MVKVKCIVTYIDLQLNKQMTAGKDVYEVTEERAKELLDKGFVEVIETPKPAKKTKKK